MKKKVKEKQKNLRWLPISSSVKPRLQFGGPALHNLTLVCAFNLDVPDGHGPQK